jgi:hypothetical protein
MNLKDQDARNGFPAMNDALTLHRRNIDAFAEAAKLALDGVQAITTQHGDFLSAAQRQFSLLLWRGMLPSPAPAGEASPAEIAQRTVVMALSHALALADIATKLQRDSREMIRRSAVDCLRVTCEDER